MRLPGRTRGSVRARGRLWGRSLLHLCLQPLRPTPRRSRATISRGTIWPPASATTTNITFVRKLRSEFKFAPPLSRFVVIGEGCRILRAGPIVGRLSPLWVVSYSFMIISFVFFHHFCYFSSFVHILLFLASLHLLWAIRLIWFGQMCF